MTFRTALLRALLVFTALVTTSTAQAGAAADVYRDALRALLSLSERSPASADLKARKSLQSLYAARDFSLLWQEPDGRLKSAAQSFLALLPQSADDGLYPAEYHLDLAKRLAALPSPTPQQVAERDLVLSDGFLLLALHLRDGRVAMEGFEPRLRIAEADDDLIGIVTEAVQFDRVEQTLDGLRPPLEGYWALRGILARYFQIEAVGGWPLISSDRSLREGDAGPDVAQLRQRLGAEPGLILPRVTAPEAFDATLRTAVTLYQVRHGLSPDGVVGPATRASINVPAHVRIRQIEANLERWRWLPQQLGPRFVLVNIANYSLSAHVDQQPVLNMRVVVGTPYRRTPVFNDEIRYFVLNPSWEIPNTVLYEDIVPQLRLDPELLRRQNIQLLGTRNGEWEEVDPDQVKWDNVLAPERPFPFRLRQRPGPANPLGRIKFVFPNKYDVYLHDTPSRGLFRQRVRDFSSGCIRVEKPLELALFLVGENSGWTQQNLEEQIASGDEHIVRLPQRIPIYIQYWTVWNGTKDNIQFRDDIYGRDDALAEALSLRS